MSFKMHSKGRTGIRLKFFLTVLSLLFFIPLFIFKGIGPFDFWWWLSFNLIILIAIILLFDRDFIKVIMDDFNNKLFIKISVGLISAVFLYFIFYAGNVLSKTLSPSSQAGIADVYRFRESASHLRITLLMLLIIGPGEELYWRGFIQRVFSDRYGAAVGFVFATSLYTLIHVASTNPMLVLAAFICGLFWGTLYRWKSSMVLNMFSHILWDISVFIVFPFKA